MTDLADNFASLSLKDVEGMLNKTQEQVYSAISALRNGKDLLSIKKNVEYMLEQVNKNLDLIKASCKEEGTNRRETDFIPVCWLDHARGGTPGNSWGGCATRFSKS